MITKEIQRAGIPVIQVTNLTKIAEGIGSNRILRGNSDSSSTDGYGM